MSAATLFADVEIDSRALGRIGPMIGQGGQSAGVFTLPDRPGFLVKRYLPGSPLDPGGLRALAAWPSTLGPADLRLIRAATTWPQRVVRFSDGWGVVIPRAPAAFSLVVEGKPTLRGLDFAYCDDAVGFAKLSPASTGAVVAIAYRFARVLDVAHRNQVVYGDVSATNVLWSGGRRPRVLVIDCDATWWTPHPRAVAAAQTQMWDDPWPSDGSAAAEVRWDGFKLALLFLRLYYRSPRVITDAISALELPADPPMSDEVRDLLWRGLRRDGPRPAPAEWFGPLDRLERFLRHRGIE